MVNIEQPLASDTSHVLREMLQNKENLFQAHENTNTDMMQECGESTTKPDNVIIGGIHNDTVSDHSDRSEGSLDGSDEESSSLEQSRMDEAEVGDSKYEADDDKFVDDSLSENKDAKRARLENIITSVHNPYMDPELGGYGVPELRRAKRKQHFPQQHESNAKMPKTDGHFEDEFWQYNQRFNNMQNYFKHLSETAKQLNGYSSLDELHRIQQAYLANLHARTSEDLHTNNNIFKSAAPLITKTENRRPTDDDPFSIAETVREKVNSNKRLNDKVTDLDERELQLLISNLKSKIEDAVSSTVDKELNKFFQKRNDELKQDELKKQNYLKEQLHNNHVNRETRRDNEPEKKTTDHSLDHILQMPSKPPATNGFQPLPGRHSAFELPKMSGRIPEIPRAPFPHPPPLGYPPLSFYLPPSLHGPSMYSCPLIPPEQTEALALVVNTPQKKKRTKVTDTRLSPRAARALLHENGALDQDRPMSGFSPMNASCLPTSVAIPNPSLHHSDILSFYKDQSMCRSPMDQDRHSPSSSHSPSEGYGFMKGDFYNDGDVYDSNGKITDTLTPMHLRKAKLMFFYVRYPSSAIIKVYFPDVQFNKNNTAQLVKWFSNFREFYYIQMEKYARQAIAEGCKHAEDLVVGTDSELYRTLNLHYNRNNQIDVPDNFRMVVQATLREFYAALLANKDTEPSWKKPIYKVIARMDDILPEYFKSPNWMDQLGDA